MKIAMVGLRGIPAKSGGVENVVDSLAPRLVGLGNDVTVYCRNPYSRERPREYKGVRLRYLPTINTKYTESIVHSFLSTLDSMFREFDVVHYHAMGNSMFTILPRLARKKTLLTLHGLDYEREKWGALAKLYLRLNEKSTLVFPDRVTAVSAKIKKHYLLNYQKNIDYIPNGVDPMKLKKISSLKRFGLVKGGYILFLSRIVPEKGIGTLIDAFKKVDTGARLVIAGDSTHTESYLESLRKKAADDERIIFTGPLYGDEKREAYSNALFFVLPSTIEGMPIVLLEAMSHGLCPLVSDIEENKDLIGDRYGFCFRSRDADDLREKLIYMLRHPKDIQSAGGRASIFVRAEFNWDKIAAKYSELYNEIKNG